MCTVVGELAGFFQFLSDGSLLRIPTATTAASPHFSNGYKSKDVVIDADKPITARIYVPYTPPEQLQPLAVLVYYHGGGFCGMSTPWTDFHNFVSSVCVVSQVIVVSVDYRLAPEHRLPAAYEDCYASLEWLAENLHVEPWLERADLSRVFLSGESAGANIAHNVMVRVVRGPIEGVEIKGLMVVHPFFGGEEMTESELANKVATWVHLGELCWQVSLPEGADKDHPACNFAKEVMDDALWKRFPAVMVFVAGLDVLKERGVNYAEFLKKKGLEEVELVDAEGEEHAFHLFRPECEATELIKFQMAEFMKQH